MNSTSFVLGVSYIYSMRWLMVSFLLVAMTTNSACGGSRGGAGYSGEEAAIVTGMAVTLLAIQKIQEEKAKNNSQPPSRACCVVCDACTFPCGDSCVPTGSICTRPKGCACTEGYAVPPELREPESPVNCQTEYFGYPTLD